MELFVAYVFSNTELRDLCSSDNHQLLVRRTRTVTFGPRVFYTSGPTSWNATLRDPAVTLGRFRQMLKAFNFYSGQTNGCC